MAASEQGAGTVKLTSRAREMLAAADPESKRRIAEGIHDLESHPEKQGKPLLAPLSGKRSLVESGRGWRIVYAPDGAGVVVLAVSVGRGAAGDRRDLHQLAKKLIRQGLA